MHSRDGKYVTAKLPVKVPCCLSICSLISSALSLINAGAVRLCLAQTRLTYFTTSRHVVQRSKGHKNDATIPPSRGATALVLLSVEAAMTGSAAAWMKRREGVFVDVDRVGKTLHPHYFAF